MIQEIQNAFSIDVEDFFHGKAFHYVSSADWMYIEGSVDKNVKIILEMLYKSNTKITFFFLGWIADNYPTLVREAEKAGHEIASHGYWHKLNIETSKTLYEDIRKSKESIEDIIGKPVYGLRLPNFGNFQIGEWFFDIIENAGYLYDSSLYPTYHDWYKWNKNTRRPHRVRPRLFEIPMSSIRVRDFDVPMGGGGYLRLLPASLFIKGISILNRQFIPANLYMHPHDIDQNSPMPRSMMKKLRRKIRIGNSLSKVEHILNSFHFGRMVDLIPMSIRD